MKKAVYMVMLVLVLASCSKDDGLDGGLNGQEITLKRGEVFAFEVKGANDVVWSVTDPFHATVNDNGQVQALRIGKTEVIADADGELFKATISVVPIVDLQEPYLRFGASKEQVKDAEKRVLMEQNEDVIVYEVNASFTNALGYIFEEDKLTSAIFQLEVDSEESGDELIDFIEERYELLEQQGTEYLFTTKDKEVAVYIDLGQVNSEEMYLIYIPMPKDADLKGSLSNDQLHLKLERLKSAHRRSHVIF